MKDKIGFLSPAILKKPAVQAFLVFTGIYAIVLAMIFWGAWSLDKVPVAPDCQTTFAIDDAAAWGKSLIAGRDFIPSDLMHFIGNMYAWVELQFALAAWLAALGVAFYLRGRGASLVACYGGGAAFGLMGYCFTLFSAGHLGWFIWLMYGPFAFGLTDRAVRKGKWINWALLGAVLAWSGARQPDLWLMFTLLTFAYGVWCLICERRTLKIKRVCVGIAITIATTLLIGMPQFTRAVFHDVAGRKKQISDSSVTADQVKGADTPEARTKERMERWLFCTSWSLPPEDTLEFVFAEIHGGSNDPRIFQKPGNKPYKGRLGQHGIVPPGRGGRHPVTGEQLKAGDSFWMPYRQHSLYFGLITLLFASVGCFGWWQMRKVSSKNESPDGIWRDMPFWMISAGVVYLCALGGFTPFYRLVFMLPLGDLIRCPVKFVHLLEFCAAVLAACGIEFLRIRFGGSRVWVVPMLAVLAIVNVFDLARVDAKYLAVQDVSFQRSANDVADDVRKLGGGKVFVAVPAREGAQLICESLNLHLADASTDASEYRFVLVNGSALRENPIYGERMKSGEFKNVGLYSFAQKTGIRRAENANASLMLLHAANVPAPVPKSDPAPDRGRQALCWASLLSTLAISTLVLVKSGRILKS